LQPITNQQPDDYKEPINKSEDKVRSCNNKVNKHMSSKLEDKVINGTNLLTLPSTKNFISQKPNCCYLNNGHKSKQRKRSYILYNPLIILDDRKHRNVRVMMPATGTI
jgi:hypothetical protein